MSKLSIQDLPLKDKKILMRVDFNVPLNDKGQITDDTRIKAALPSIEYVLNQNGALILMSHLGRPKGKDKTYSLAPCAKKLSQLLNRSVIMAPDCIGKSVEELANQLTAGDILLLENLRFHEGEEHPEEDPSFAKSLASLADIYVNNAFGAAHRKHASITTITQYFPQRAVTGFLLDKEIAFLSSLINQPKRPFYAILGGAKVCSKIGVVDSLLSKVDALFVGGGMAYTFLKAQGISIGNSIFEPSYLDKVKKMISTCEEKAVKLFLPSDLVISKNESEHKIISTKDGIEEDWKGVDIGPKTIQEWSEVLTQSATVFWNGPLGIFEIPTFAKGTYQIAKALASLQATTIIGGGDSVAAIHQMNLSDKFTHLSTGGGASLEYLEFGHLPGIDALCER